MASIKDDTTSVKAEFEALSNSTQVFVWSLVSIGVIIGLLLGGAVMYGVAVEEHEGRDCIEYEDEWYCAGDEADQAEAEDDADETD
ncbi:MAG: hypothetical protein JJT89_18475 [Nitriliruptoraceae bacterium]|nr:hypothetical protein [Nitriliruptoraceae bacterium]